MDDSKQAQSQSPPQQLLLSPGEENIIKILRFRRQSKFPEPICEKVDEAVDEFLEKIKGAVHEMIFYIPYAVIRAGGEEMRRRGLDFDLDTEEQVEATIKFFPSVLTEKKRGAYPIRWQCNMKAVSFVPLFAKVGIELEQFPEEERGGLLVADSKGHNVLQYIACISDVDRNKRENKDHHHRFDEKRLAVLNRLQGENLLSKEDIRKHNLIGLLCSNKHSFFPEQRFRFLSDWDPTTLMTPCRPEKGNYLPIIFTMNTNDIGVRGFQVVSEAGMRHYPTKLGFVFHKSKSVDGTYKMTPYRNACKKYGSEIVTKEILDRISEQFPATGTSTESVLLSLAADEAIDLDGMYLFLRRDPAVLLRLPQTGHNTVAISNNNLINGEGTSTTKRKRRDEKKDDSSEELVPPDIEDDFQFYMYS